MCNSSLQINISTASFEETQKWFMYCICEGYYGSLILITTTSIFTLVATPAHCWTLWLFLHEKLKPNLVFLINFTLIDLVLCIQSFGDIIAGLHATVDGYKMTFFLITVCWTVRPLLQMCTCIEHYLAVIHPVMFLRYKGIRYRIAPALFVWILGLCNGLRLIFSLQNFFPDQIFFLIFWISVTVICFCCASVLHALKHSGPRDNHDQGRAAENQQKQKAFKTISQILFSILVCYMPQVVTYIMFIAEISKVTYTCNVFPLNLSITLLTTLISSLVKMYKEGSLKCSKCISKH